MDAEFGHRLRELRKQAGMTQQQLAEAAGISTGAVQDFEQGRFEPGWGSVRKLARALRVDCTAFDQPAVASENATPGRPRKLDEPSAETPPKRPKGRPRKG